MDNLATEIKWRGSTYQLVSVADGLVTWVNPMSKHSESCPIESWQAGEPYDRTMGAS